MIHRLALPLIAASLLLVAPASFAQPVVAIPPRPETLPEEQAPKEISAALRARVNEFFQYHVDSGPALRKAMDLVADDTKDEYFATGKMKVEKFHITEVSFAPGFEKAKVVLDVTREWNFYAQPKGEIVTLPMVTFWKIEDGAWRWYKDKSVESITPMGVTNMVTMGKEEELLRQKEDGTLNLPPDFNKPERLAAQAELILQQSKVDKNTVKLSVSRISEDTVTFVNGYGSVNLELYGMPDVPGLTASIEKGTLNTGENGVIHFRYDPAAAKEAGPVSPLTRNQSSFVVRLLVEPFNQMFPISVDLDKSSDSAQ